MRCKKHIADLTSSIGVCASCLRDRLEAILAAQAQQSRVVPRATPAVASSSDHNQQKKPEHPPPLTVPNSVSPYVARRKSDLGGKNNLDRSFYSTPQVGPGFSPAASAECDGGRTAPSKKRLGKFWNIANLFRTRSNKPVTPQDSCAPTSSVAATPSPAFLSTILHNRRHNREENKGGSTIHQSDCETEEFSNEWRGHDRSTSAESGFSTEPSPLRRNPTAATVERRSRFGPSGKSVTKLVLCLSPLVRASPNRHWSHSGLSQELGAPVSGTHQHVSSAASFCPNRSRKFADFGRVAHHNR